MKPLELTCTSVAITAKGLGVHAWVVDLDDDASPWRVSWMPKRDLTRHAAVAAMRVAARRLSRFGPVQAGDFLALDRFQIDRAETMPGLPSPVGYYPRQWSRQAVYDIAERIDEVLAFVGTVPDLGAHRAAAYLADKLDCEVSAAGVAELARQGRIGTAGDYKGHTLYSGHSLEAFDDAEAAWQATETGCELTGDDAAALLRLRRADFDHLARAGLVTAARTFCTRFGNTVALYRAGDLTDLETARTDIDWAAVRATPKGRRSLLSRLPTATDRST